MFFGLHSWSIKIKHDFPHGVQPVLVHAIQVFHQLPFCPWIWKGSWNKPLEFCTLSNLSTLCTRMSREQEERAAAWPYTIMLLVIHQISSSQTHLQTPWSTWLDFNKHWTNHLSALKAFWLGWSTGATTFREWNACTGLSCTFLWVICIFTCCWNWPDFSDYSLNLWIEMSAKYARACQNWTWEEPQVLFASPSEARGTHWHCWLFLWYTVEGGTAQNIFAEGQGGKKRRFPFILKMFCSSDICMFQCPLFINEYAVMVLSYDACRGEYI